MTRQQTCAWSYRAKTTGSSSQGLRQRSGSRSAATFALIGALGLTTAQLASAAGATPEAGGQTGSVSPAPTPAPTTTPAPDAAGKPGSATPAPVTAPATAPVTLPPPATASIQTSPPQPWGPERQLTLEDAYKQAIKSSPDLNIARSRLAQVQLIRSRIIASLQPMVNVSANYTRNSNEASFNMGDLATGIEKYTQIYTDYALQTQGLPGVSDEQKQYFDENIGAKFNENFDNPIVIQPLNAYGFTAAANWSIFNARTIPLFNQAVSTVKATEFATAWGQRELLYGVAQAYYGLYTLQQVVKVNEELLDSKRRHLDLTQARLAAGQVSQSDVLRAEVDVVQATRQLRDAQQAVHNTAADVATLLGLEGVELRASGVSAQERPTGDLDALVKQALDRRPDLRAARLQISAAESGVTDARMEFMPSFTLTANYHWSNAAGFSGSQSTWAAGAVASLPIWDGGLKLADVREAKQKLFQAQESQRKLDLQVRKEVQVAMANLEQARVNLAAAEEELKLSKRTAEQMEALYAAGRATSLELRDTTLLVTSSELNQVRMTLSLAQSILALKRAAGEFAPDRQP